MRAYPTNEGKKICRLSRSTVKLGFHEDVPSGQLSGRFLRSVTSRLLTLNRRSPNQKTTASLDLSPLECFRVNIPVPSVVKATAVHIWQPCRQR